MEHRAFFEREATRVLEGRHVLLRPLREDDAEPMARCAAEDRTSYAWAMVPGSAEEAVEYVAQLLEARARREVLPFATVRASSGEVVGGTRFLTLRWYFGREEPDAVEIGGTWLAGSAQRTALNTEAKLLMMGRAFDEWGVVRVDIKTDERNERSRRAIERLGARFEGVLRAWQSSQSPGEEGEPRDTAMYSVLAAEWPDVQARLLARLDAAPE